MNIVNLTSTDIEFDSLGFTLLANESRNLRDIDDFFILSSHLDELVQPMLDNLVQFEEDGNIFSTIASISSYLNTGITKVDINNDNVIKVQLTDQEIRESDNDYYYFKKSLKIPVGMKFEFEFKGRIKSLFVDLKEGSVEVDINNMGKIELTDFTVFEFDIDYNLKDPVIEISSNKIASLNIFVEGLYYNPNKSKKQYLQELNNTEPEIDVPIIPETQEILFNCNLSDTSYLSDNVFVDSIANQIGFMNNVPENFLQDKILKNSEVNFGEILNINPKEDYCLSTWFKIKEPNFSNKTITNKSFTTNRTYMSIDDKTAVDFTSEFTINLDFTLNGLGGIIFNKESSYELQVSTEGELGYAVKKGSWAWIGTGITLNPGTKYNIEFKYSGTNSLVQILIDNVLKYDSSLDGVEGIWGYRGTYRIPSSLDITPYKLMFGARPSGSYVQGTFDNISIYTDFNKTNLLMNFTFDSNVSTVGSYTCTFNNYYITTNTVKVKQYLLYNEGNYELYFLDGILYLNEKPLMKDFLDNKWYNVILSYINNEFIVYINSNYINSIPTNITNGLSDFIVGKDLSGIQIQKIRFYNYAFSSSMVLYAFNQQNPEFEEMLAELYENGVRANFFRTESADVTPRNGYEFLVIEKKYSNTRYFFDSQETDTLDSVSNVLPDKDRFLSILEGYIYCPEDGLYTFGVDGDDAVEFSIDEKVIASWYNNHAAGQIHSGEVTLTKGYYKFKFRHFENYGAASFKLYWQLPSATSLVIIPSTNLYRRKISPFSNTGLFGLNNCVPYGCSFDTNFDSTKASIITDTVNTNLQYFEIKNHKIVRLKDLNKFRHQTEFTLNAWIYSKSSYNYLFSIGNKDYSDYMNAYQSSKDKISWNFEGNSKRISKNIEAYKWTMITAVGTNNKITFYKNGVEIGDKNIRTNSYYEYLPMFFNIGTTSSGNPPRYMNCNFYISEFFFDNRMYTKSDLLGLYKKQGEKYGL